MDCLEPALQKLLKDSSKKNTKLRDSISASLEKLKSSGDVDGDGRSPADAYMAPLLLACGSGQPKVIVTALDCIDKLMNYGFLCGNSKAKSVGLGVPEGLEDRVEPQAICWGNVFQVKKLLELCPQKLEFSG